jgi:hypothetical protein
MQYFLGYSSFVNEKPFDASLFVDIRKRLAPFRRYAQSCTLS